MALHAKVNMDVSKYEFACQKALHQGLQLAKSLAHRALEVEHIALALLRSEDLVMDSSLRAALSRTLQLSLGQMAKNFLIAVKLHLKPT